MPNIKKVELESKTIKGLKIRTKNSDEMNPQTQKIAPLWGKFFEEMVPTLNADASMYGVYHNYESDAMGAFDVLVGADMLDEGNDVQSVTLEEGKYLMFPVIGEMPQAIIDVWGQVWAYFEDPSIDEVRSFETDFECYTGVDTAEIYIGVNYL